MTIATFDVKATMLALAGQLRAALVPGVATIVYDDMPDLISARAPSVFLDFTGDDTAPDTQRSYAYTAYVSVTCLAGLAVNIRDTDIAIKAFPGAVLAAITTDPTLGGAVNACMPLRGKTVGVPVAGAGNQSALYVAYVLDVAITQYVTAGEC